MQGRKTGVGMAPSGGSKSGAIGMGWSSLKVISRPAFPNSRKRGFPIPTDELTASLVPVTLHGAGF